MSPCVPGDTAGEATRATSAGTALAQARAWHNPGAFLTVLLPKAVAVANNLACRGLDHLEEKIPALQYPVDKVSHRQDNLTPPSPSGEPTVHLL